MCWISQNNLVKLLIQSICSLDSKGKPIFYVEQYRDASTMTDDDLHFYYIIFYFMRITYASRKVRLIYAVFISYFMKNK